MSDLQRSARRYHHLERLSARFSYGLIAFTVVYFVRAAVFQ
jgi:hypothetical protein